MRILDVSTIAGPGYLIKVDEDFCMNSLIMDLNEEAFIIVEDVVDGFTLIIRASKVATVEKMARGVSLDKEGQLVHPTEETDE